MQENKQIVATQPQAIQSFSSDEIATIKNTMAKDATDAELKLFLYQCQRTGLSPLARQIYFLKMGGKASIQASIDGLRLIAERSQKYQGQTLPVFLDESGKWHEVWTDPTYPIAAKVGIFRSDFKEPMYAIARWDAYALVYNGRVGAMWAKMPDVMLAKVAEALALRKAFPNDLWGIYSAEEMQQAETPTVVVQTYDTSAVAEDADVTSTGDDLGDEPPKSSEPAPARQPTLGQKKALVQQLLVRQSLVELKRKQDYADACLVMTGLELKEENYDAIITKLNDLQHGKLDES